MSKVLSVLALVACLFQIVTVTCYANVLGASDLFNLKEPENASRRFTKDEPVCGYPSCPSLDPNKINVHIVAHTHDDVGWLKTVDQYYYGTKKQFSQVGVQHILDSVIPQLVMDITKRFIYVEMSFFSKWWREQDSQMKLIVQRLVDEGRLEFINGGWCMNDEATVTYHSTIEQMTLGLRFLNETFGSCGRPKVGWQIDPFGHTNEQASMFAQFGFDGMFFTRIGYEDKRQRSLNKSLDIMWHGDRVLSGQTGSIFTSIFRDGYDTPNGYCHDVLCMDDNLVDNEESYEYNIKSKSENLVDFLRRYSESRLTNNILIPFGGDFQYSAAGQNFKNIDKLIKYIRRNFTDINIFYSTPSCYQYAINQLASGGDKSQIRLPEKFDDFMPYDSSYSVWWSGYFASRPSVKLIERETADLLQVTRYVSMANLLKSDDKQWIDEVREHEAKCLMPLWEILGDLQHHDAVTGTEKQHVADDYVRRASGAMAVCSRFIGELRRRKLNVYLKKSPLYEPLRESGSRFKLDPVFLESTTLCNLLNISQCDPMEANIDYKRYLASMPLKNKQDSPDKAAKLSRTARSSAHKISELPPELETKSVLLNVYNPLARPIVQHDIRLPCNGRCDLNKVKVVHLSTNETMKLIRLPVPSGVIKLPFRDALTNYEILFYANIPALGYTSFVIEDVNNEEIVDEETDSAETLVITDETNKEKTTVRSRRVRSDEEPKYEYFPMKTGILGNERPRRETNSFLSQQNVEDRVIVKFDTNSGMIVGLKRVSDGSVLNITQKFGYYFPSTFGSPPGAYIFRPNSSEPNLFEKPLLYKMYKRKSGALIEIHQKWADWLWQTIRVDAKRNYIEFDYLVGPIPLIEPRLGREVVTRYITNMSNDGVFLTDSNGRQLLARHRLRSDTPEQLGGSFFPVVSTIMMKNAANSSKCIKCSAEAFAILVDRAQAGTSLNDGQLELLIHRRQMHDDHFGVEEALNEPGEDGRGLVSRGKHRLYLKFPDHQVNHEPQTQSAASHKLDSKKTKSKLIKLAETPRGNLDYEQSLYYNRLVDITRSKTPVTATSTYIVHDQVFNDLSQESRRHALKPVLTFDRLRVSANDFIEMIAPDGSSKVKTDLALLNTTLPNNVHLLTLQPWTRANEILIRLENLDNPLTVHPFPDYDAYRSLIKTYRAGSDYHELSSLDSCADKLRPRVEVDLEYLIKRFRIVSLDELNLGANQLLRDDKRLDWTDEPAEDENCQATLKFTSIKLAPRQIRTFLAKLELIQ